MEIYTVSFFGHRQMKDYFAVEEKLEKIILELMDTKGFVEFLVGRGGEFDQLAASAVRRCKRTFRNDNSALTLVLPYMTAEYRDNADSYQAYYDEVEICELSSKTHYKAAYQVRNRTMVDRSDLVVFYVERSSGGAYQTMKYAQCLQKRTINLGLNPYK